MNDNYKNIDYSIIVPVFYNEGTLRKLFLKIKNKVIDKNNDKKAEIIFVDDGSGDNSLLELLKLKNEYPKLIKIIKFSRNFGQLSAIYAGYELAHGNCIINISADLQDPPELINEMIYRFFNENYDIVICTRQERDENLIRRVTSFIFYSLIKKLSFPNMPIGGFDFVLISKRVKKIILDNYEANSFWQGKILWSGFNIYFIRYKRSKRMIGKSMWTFSKKIKYLIDATLSYSYLPIRLMTTLGGIIASVGFLYAIIIIINRLSGNVPFKGWAPIVILILILSGFQMLMLGIIGEYLWRTLDQVRKRPLYIIDKIYD